MKIYILRRDEASSPISPLAVMDRHRPFLIVSVVILTIQVGVLLLLAVQTYAQNG